MGIELDSVCRLPITNRRSHRGDFSGSQMVVEAEHVLGVSSGVLRTSKSRPLTRAFLACDNNRR
jgi:hypothetical protein